MQSSTGRKGQYSVTANGSKVSNHGIVLETEENTQTTDLKFNVDLKNFPTSEVYNDTLTFDAQNGYAIGTVLEIEGYKLIVLSQTGANRYLVIDGDSIGNIQFQPNQDSDGNNINIGEWTGKQDSKRHDGMNSNTYEGSYIDNYLENTWYNSLPETLKSMIVETDIQQKAGSRDNGTIHWYWRWYNENDTMTDGVKATSSTWYYNEGTQDSPKWITCWNAKFREGDTGVYPISHWSEHDTGYNGQQYNVLKRHVFLPSLSDLTSIVNLDNPGKTRQFCKQLSSGALAHAWTRDARRESSSLALDVHYDRGSPNNYSVAYPWVGVRPAFELDLTNLSSVVINGTAKYK